MIQRIQTLFLLLATVALVTALFLPLGTVIQPDSPEHTFFSALGTEAYHPMGYAAVLILSALISLASIFLWKNRPLQIRLSVFNILIMGVSYLVYFIYKMTQAGIVEYFWGISFFLPAAAIVCTYLAIRGIRKDEKIIRSLDRIR